MGSQLPANGASIPELTQLRSQLEDLRAKLAAIRGGGVDAIMVGAPSGERLYTLTSADRPYRVIVEIGEGAATVSEHGVLLYVNRRLAGLIGVTGVTWSGPTSPHWSLRPVARLWTICSPGR